MKKMWLVMIAVGLSMTASGQAMLEPRLQTSNGADTTGVLQPSLTQQQSPLTPQPARYPKPHPWRAAAEVAGINVIVHCFDRFVLREDFAKTTLNSIRDNFQRGFVWDNDNFNTNLFAHPYHGNLYFNAARTNGMNFWQSYPFALGGSLMWEFLGENTPPSINDLLATSIGGTAIGETTYRVHRAGRQQARVEPRVARDGGRTGEPRATGEPTDDGQSMAGTPDEAQIPRPRCDTTGIRGIGRHALSGGERLVRTRGVQSLRKPAVPLWRPAERRTEEGYHWNSACL